MSILWFLLMRIFENGFGSFLRLGNIKSLLAMNGPQSIRGYLSTTTIITDNNAKKINVIIFGGENTIATNNNALPPKRTTNDPAKKYRVCVCTALPTVDSITTATLHSCCICFHCLIVLKKRMGTCDNSKGGG